MYCDNSGYVQKKTGPWIQGFSVHFFTDQEEVHHTHLSTSSKMNHTLMNYS